MLKHTMALLIVTLVMFAAPARAGMFDLPPGTWTRQEDPHHTLTLQVGDPSTRTLNLDWDEHSKDSNGVHVRGTYVVTATKGDYHVKWTITGITYSGFRKAKRDPDGANILGASLRKGQTVRMILDYRLSGKVNLVLFDEQIQPTLQRELSKPAPVQH